jgi:hypothetical protein
MSESATFTLNIAEDIYLKNNFRNSTVTESLPDVTSVDNRILNIPSGSTTQVIAFSSSLANAAAGTIENDKLAYLRLTNIDTTGSIYLVVSGSVSSSYEVKLGVNQPFILNNTHMLGGTEQVASITAYVGGDTQGTKTLEVYSATL